MKNKNKNKIKNNFLIKIFCNKRLNYNIYKQPIKNRKYIYKSNL